MGFEEGTILLDHPTQTYQPGETVNGRLIFKLTKVKEVRGLQLKVKGFCQVHWTSQESHRVNDRTEHRTVNHDAYEEYIKLEKYLVGSSNGSVSLNPGDHAYPFSFHLPSSCPSSYESQYAHIRYQIKVVADRAFKVDQKIYMPFTVAAHVDLNALNCSDPVEFEFDQTYCCWCVSSGSSETVVKLPSTGFLPGEDLPVEVRSQNKSSVEIDEIKFKIKREITYRATNKPATKHIEDDILKEHKGPVPPHTDRRWELRLSVPALDLYNLASCSYITIKYKLKVIVSPDGCHEDSEDSTDIIFGTIPLREVDAPEPPPGQLPALTLGYPHAPPGPIVNQPVPNQNVYQTAAPYPQTGAPYPQTGAPYPQTGAPYPQTGAPYPQTGAPYPQTGAPYPQTGAPYPPTTSPYPPTAAPYPPSVTPYPPTVTPYPPTASPYPAPYPGPAGAPVAAGFVSPAAPPALPPGAGVPYPPNASPFATANAPVIPPTPDSNLDAPDYNVMNSSPYNPEFQNGK